MIIERREWRKGKIHRFTKEIRFTSPDEFWDVLDANIGNKTCAYVFAHNLGFDAQVVSFDTIPVERGWTMVEYAHSHRLLFVTFRKGNRSIRMIDTLNYFQTSLAKLGEQFGYPKLRMPDDDASVEEWDTYCLNDCRVIRHAVNEWLSFLDENDLGNFQKTAASQAFTAFRHRYLDTPILILSDPVVENAERDAYYGGRCQAFRIGEIDGPIYKLDVNSLYPSVMRDHVMPTKLLLRTVDVAPEKVAQLPDTVIPLAHVFIETDEPAYPVRRNGRLIFPTGRFWTTLIGEELRDALVHGRVKRVAWLHVYAAAPIFSRFVEDLYGLRLRFKKEGNEAFAYCAKLILNSLYGKFGQRGYRWTPCQNPAPVPDLQWYDDCQGSGRRLLHLWRGDRVWHRLDEGEAENSFPAIAAAVTSAARARMLRAIRKAGWENVLYTDTDSLFVTQAGYERLRDEIDPDRLGFFKLEGVSERVTIYGPKDYVFSGEWKAKGIRKDAVAVDAQRWSQWHFRSAHALLNRGVHDAVEVVRVVKELRREIKYGSVTGDGHVIPMNLDEDVNLSRESILHKLVGTPIEDVEVDRTVDPTDAASIAVLLERDKGPG
jgi:hypothetical protein